MSEEGEEEEKKEEKEKIYENPIFDAIVKLGTVLGFGGLVAYLFLERSEDAFGAIIFSLFVAFLMPIIWLMNAKYGRAKEFKTYDVIVILAMVGVVILAMILSFIYYMNS